MKYFVILCLVGFSAARKLPSYINVCKPKHTNIDQCIIDNIEFLRPKLREGIPELGIPSIDPLVIPFAEVNLGDSFKASVKNAKLWGGDQFILESLKIDLDKVALQLKLKIPYIRAEAEYNVKGNVLILALDGTGPGQINITDLEATITASGAKEEKNGKTYIIVKNAELVPKTGKISVKLENLFPNNPELTRNANKLFNENQELLVEEFGPLVTEVVKKLMVQAITEVFSKFPYDVLFPDD